MSEIKSICRYFAYADSSLVMTLVQKIRMSQIYLQFLNLCISENRTSEIQRSQGPDVRRKIAWAGNTT